MLTHATTHSRDVTPDGENQFYAFCPALKGLHTCGDTIEQALNNAKDAITAYLISLLKHNEPIPLALEPDKQESEYSFNNATQYIENIPVAAAAYC